MAEDHKPESPVDRILARGKDSTAGSAVERLMASRTVTTKQDDPARNTNEENNGARALQNYLETQDGKGKVLRNVEGRRAVSEVYRNL